MEKAQLFKQTEQTEQTERTSKNLTGIPTQMKWEFEQKSGLCFDDVRVHYGSDKPLKFGALAYAQGNQVYIGPGQEHCLRHELGHVVQQKQRQVQPDYVQNGQPVCVAASLERMADRSPNKLPVRPGVYRPVIQLQPRRFNYWPTNMKTRRMEKLARQEGKSYDQLSEDDKQRYRALIDKGWDEKLCSVKGNRTTYMGSTPKKTSTTGKALLNILLNNQGRTYSGNKVVFANGEYQLKPRRQNYYIPLRSYRVHMGHIYPAVTFWNRIGRYTGARSNCVRAFMEDPNNYEFQDGRSNCSSGPHDERYEAPVRNPDRNYPYKPCPNYGDESEINNMEKYWSRNGNGLE